MNDDRRITRFFQRFVAAFETFDGRAVGQLFITPGVALRRDGTLAGFAEHGDVVAYYQAALDRYRAAGCSRCRCSEIDSLFLNDGSAIATATWRLLDGRGSVISHWRQAYFLVRSDDDWRCYGSAFVSADASELATRSS